MVEDDRSLREVLTTVLEHDGYPVVQTASAEEGWQRFQQGTFSCVLSDFRLTGNDGVWLLRQIRGADLQVPFLLMTAYGSIEMAVEAMKLGANDFITKPFEPAQLKGCMESVLTHRQLVRRATCGEERPFYTCSPLAQRVLQRAKKIGAVDSSVLIVGESGTGKELLSRHIHLHSRRRDKPFFAINCAAMPPDLLESELFGHVEGAFTGATQTRVGLFEFASEGTLFLDEIGEMPLYLQVKLLRVLQEREIRPVGSTIQIPVNPRIIAATNVNIEEALNQGALREDFYFRLAVFTLEIPPLRKRPEDIEYLVTHFLTSSRARRQAGDTPRISDAAWEVLRDYPWPGNVRELENVIERALILAEGEILPEHLGIVTAGLQSGVEEATLTLQKVAEQAARSAEIETISKVLAKTAGNKAEAARVLGVSYKTLLTKVRDYQLGS